MAKANLTLPNGTTVNIEGTAEEVTSLLAIFSQPESSEGATKIARKKKSKKSSSTTKKKAINRTGSQQLIEELSKEGFFKTKQPISSIQKKLEEKGHIYSIESLSTPLLRLTRKRILRRMKENKQWVYVS